MKDTNWRNFTPPHARYAAACVARYCGAFYIRGQTAPVSDWQRPPTSA